MSGANHPGSPPKIHQYLEDEACGVLAAVVELSQSVMVSASLHRRGRGRALRRTQQAGLLPLLWQDNKRIYLLGGQDFRACVLLLLRYPPTCFLCKIFAGERRVKCGRVEWFYKYDFMIKSFITDSFSLLLCLLWFDYLFCFWPLIRQNKILKGVIVLFGSMCCTFYTFHRWCYRLTFYTCCTGAPNLFSQLHQQITQVHPIVQFNLISSSSNM